MGLGVRWTLHGDGRTPTPGAVVRPDERLSWPRTAGLGAQHVVAMSESFVAPAMPQGPKHRPRGPLGLKRRVYSSPIVRGRDVRGTHPRPPIRLRPMRTTQSPPPYGAGSAASSMSAYQQRDRT